MKQTPQEFFAEYTAARSAMEGECRRLQAELAKTYCHPDEPSQQRADWERGQVLEHVSDVLDHGDSVELFTETESEVIGTKRYFLVRDSERWRIDRVQVRCEACHGTGVGPIVDLYDDSRRRCKACSGLGWLAWRP
jgi:DnaJ-class molecular chaperone